MLEDRAAVSQAAAFHEGPGWEPDDPGVTLYDLRKAYPGTNRPIQWENLRRKGVPPRTVTRVKALHEKTVYRVRMGRETGKPIHPQRGLREGCATSPVLFNVYHAEAMSEGRRRRHRSAEQRNLSVGVPWKWCPGKLQPVSRRWRKVAQAQTVNFEHALFADDTTGIHTRAEKQNMEEAYLGAMHAFEEEINETKTEHAWFTRDCPETGVLGVWTDRKVDGRNRRSRGFKAWSGIRSKLKRTQMSHEKAAMVVESVVGSTVLYAVEARAWNGTEIEQLQRMMDVCWRYLWSKAIRGTGAIRKRMQEHGINMAGIRTYLGVRSVHSMIEEKGLRWIGHVFRLLDTRPVKAALLGWMDRKDDLKGRRGAQPNGPRYWRALLATSERRPRFRGAPDHRK